MIRTDISSTDRIGNGIIAGFIVTLAMSAFHEPMALLAQSAGVRAPVAGLLFHFFVGTLLWGGLFGFLHDFLPGPSYVRGIIFAAAAAVILLLGVAPLSGAGLLCLKLGVFAPLIVVLFHLAYGAALGGIYGKLVDTEEADHRVGHAR